MYGDLHIVYLWIFILKSAISIHYTVHIQQNKQNAAHTYKRALSVNVPVAKVQVDHRI